MSLNIHEFSKTVRLSDGALGTQLQQRGLAAGAAPELWNVDNPAAVAEVAAAYVQAGSDVILTNTFGANRFLLTSHGLADRTVELVEAAVAIARQAAGDNVKVFASIGPTGKIVMMEDVAEDELSAAFAEAAAAAARSGADAIVLETFNELAELKIALAAATGACDLPVIASMTFASGPDKTATMMGESPADLATAAQALGAAAVGANCGCGPDNYVKVAALLREATDLPIWIKPNAGLPELVNSETVFRMGAEEFAAFTPAMIEAGVNFLGGCCGTTPEHIAAVRKALDSQGS